MCRNVYSGHACMYPMSYSRLEIAPYCKNRTPDHASMNQIIHSLYNTMRSSPVLSTTVYHACLLPLKYALKDTMSFSQPTSLLGVHLHLVATDFLDRLVCRPPSVQLPGRARLLLVHFLRYRDRVISTESLAHIDHAASASTEVSSSQPWFFFLVFSRHILQARRHGNDPLTCTR